MYLVHSLAKHPRLGSIIHSVPLVSAPLAGSHHGRWHHGGSICERSTLQDCKPGSVEGFSLVPSTRSRLLKVPRPLSFAMQGSELPTREPRDQTQPVHSTRLNLWNPWCVRICFLSLKLVEFLIAAEKCFPTESLANASQSRSAKAEDLRKKPRVETQARDKPHKPPHAAPKNS